MDLWRVAQLAIVVRLIHLSLLLLSDYALPDYDSSKRLHPVPCNSTQQPPYNLHGATYNPGSAWLRPLEGLLVWDSVFFARIARHGYEYEQFYAFLPLQPFLASLLGAQWVALSALLTSLLSSVIGAVLFAALSRDVLRDTKLAASATLFFLLGQACVFYTAAYTESLFTALTMAGLCCLYCGGGGQEVGELPRGGLYDACTVPRSPLEQSTFEDSISKEQPLEPLRLNEQPPGLNDTIALRSERQRQQQEGLHKRPHQSQQQEQQRQRGQQERQGQQEQQEQQGQKDQQGQLQRQPPALLKACTRKPPPHHPQATLTRLTAACIAFTLASCTRSNGFINAGYLAHYALGASLLSWQQGRTGRAAAHLAAGAATAAAVVAPLAAFQLHGYSTFCCPPAATGQAGSKAAPGPGATLTALDPAVSVSPMGEGQGSQRERFDGSGGDGVGASGGVCSGGSMGASRGDLRVLEGVLRPLMSLMMGQGACAASANHPQSPTHLTSGPDEGQGQGQRQGRGQGQGEGQGQGQGEGQAQGQGQDRGHGQGDGQGQARGQGQGQGEGQGERTGACSSTAPSCMDGHKAQRSTATTGSGSNAQHAAIDSSSCQFESNGTAHLNTDQPPSKVWTPRPWCSRRPPGIYGFVQYEYWGVGFLRYWQLQQLPNFLLASPALLIAAGGVATYALAHPRLLLLGGWPQLLPHYTISASPPAASMHRGPQLGAQMLGRLGPNGTGFLSAAVAVHVYPWAFMALCALLVMHVQVATRFLSCCPTQYWFLAHLCSQPHSNLEGDRHVVLRQSYWKVLAWGLCLVYTTVGTVMLPNFYPWT